MRRLLQTRLLGVLRPGPGIFAAGGAEGEVEVDRLVAGRVADDAEGVAALADGLDLVVGGLAQLGEAPAPQRYRDSDARLLIARLEAYLRNDDARAEDVMTELCALPAVSVHVEQLAAIQRAVDDIEYQQALAPLGLLSRALHNELEVS